MVLRMPRSESSRGVNQLIGDFNGEADTAIGW